MSFSTSIKQALQKLFSLTPPTFSEIVLHRDVAESMCDFAKTTHPKEFVAVISGKIRNNQLHISDLYYKEFLSSRSSASFSSFMPGAENGIGTVHSHPSGNNHPSSADLRFFNKKGFVHFIIGNPYTQATIACYDYHGNPLSFMIN